MPDSFAVSLQYLLPKQEKKEKAGKRAPARPDYFNSDLVRVFV